MRCSLLVLSSYLDRELSPERAAEVDAHVIGCTRCRTALGYLREESERIGGLARVRVPEEAGYQMFVALKLMEPEDLPEMDSPPPASQHLSGAPTWPVPEPHHLDEPVEHRVDTFGGEHHTGEDEWTHYGPDLFENAELDTARTEPIERTVAHEAGEIELAGSANEAAFAPPQPPPVAPIQPSAEKEIAPPMPPPLPGPPQRVSSGVPGFMHRIREAVSVRLALMRGGTTSAFDESTVHITTSGGPSTAGETGRWEFDDEELSDKDRETALWPTPHRAPAATAVAEPPRRVIAPAEPPKAQPVERPITPVPVERAITPAPVAPAQPPSPAPPPPGRHTRSLGAGGGAARPSWMRFDSLTRRAHAISIGRPAVGVPARDRRLWVFAAAVLVFGVVGVIAGKSVSSLPVATTQSNAPHPSVAPSLAPQPSFVPSAAATPIPTPAPTPPPPPSPVRLSEVQTAGTGAAGYHVGNLRYGTHPNDFRLVFDLVGTTPGTPKVIVGFGNATTLYVEFMHVMPNGLPKNPLPGNTVVTAHVLAPQTVAGRTIYQFDLAHGATLSVSYPAWLPHSLVIDLGTP